MGVVMEEDEATPRRTVAMILFVRLALASTRRSEAMHHHTTVHKRQDNGCARHHLHISLDFAKKSGISDLP